MNIIDGADSEKAMRFPCKEVLCLRIQMSVIVQPNGWWGQPAQGIVKAFPRLAGNIGSNTSRK